MFLWSSLGRKSLSLSGMGGPFWRSGNNDKNSKVRDAAFKLSRANSFPSWKHLVSLRQNLPCCTATTDLRSACSYALGVSCSPWEICSQGPLLMATFSGINCMHVLMKGLHPCVPPTLRPHPRASKPHSQSTAFQLLEISHTVTLERRETVQNRKALD